MRVIEIEIETWGTGVEAYEGHLIAQLPSVIAEFGGHGAAVSAGGLTGGIGASFGVDIGDNEPDAWALGEAMRIGVDTFRRASEKVGLELGGMARVAVLTQEMLDRENDQEPEVYYGASELAHELGVSRQRVAELRTREDFPAPVVELAAGPVWTGSSVRRFEEAWTRKPGRPRRSAAGDRSPV
jgi:hypothetical protein